MPEPGVATVESGIASVKARFPFIPRPLHPPRILCVTLRAGSIGHAVLDGFGVAEESFFARRLSHLRDSRRLGALARFVCSSCRRYRTSRIVLGLPESVTPDRQRLADRLRTRLERLTRRVVVVRRIRDAARLLLDRARVRLGQVLVDRVATAVAPSLAHLTEKTRRVPMYRRAAWYAVAVAFAELVAVSPFTAAALAQPAAFKLDSFRTALAEALTRV